MPHASWQPPGLDVDIPNAARMYDYSLGGAHNFAADRAAADALWEVLPDAPLVGQSNRAFLQRVVRYCCEQGVGQFLDLGSGIPTAGNVHEIALRLDPQCRVVYVDNEPIAVATTQRLLTDVPNAAIVPADIRQPDLVLTAPETSLLDFSRPLALMLVAVLHYVSDVDDPVGLVRQYASVLAPGSLVAISHTTQDPRPEVAAAMQRVWDDAGLEFFHRTREQVAALFAGLDLVPPGVVWTPQWHPADDTEPLYAEPARSATFAGVARVPA
jgi:SAM-dependent methyltransferase